MKYHLNEKSAAEMIISLLITRLSALVRVKELTPVVNSGEVNEEYLTKVHDMYNAQIITLQDAIQDAQRFLDGLEVVED
jgi:hypothetical protein